MRDSCVTLCVVCYRLEEIQSPSKKLPPESTPRVLFTGFEPAQVQQYTKVPQPVTAHVIIVAIATVMEMAEFVYFVSKRRDSKT